MNLTTIITILALAFPISLTAIAFYGYILSVDAQKLIHAQKKKATQRAEEVISPLIDRDIYLSAFQAKKILSEIVRIVLDRYRTGNSLVRNAPQEAEYFAGELIRAMNKLESGNVDDVLSGLNTFRALGTENLLNSLEDELNVIYSKWGLNTQVMRMLDVTEAQMRTRMNKQMQVGVVGPNSEAVENNAVVEVSY